jgi:hypothetical protein
VRGQTKPRVVADTETGLLIAGLNIVRLSRHSSPTLSVLRTNTLVE